MNNKTSAVSRRDALKFGGLTVAGTFALPFQPVMAGPFSAGDFEKLVPGDKKLDEA